MTRPNREGQEEGKPHRQTQDNRRIRNRRGQVWHRLRSSWSFLTGSEISLALFLRHNQLFMGASADTADARTCKRRRNKTKDQFAGMAAISEELAGRQTASS